ncbi:apoptosis-stimulating of p53 protein 1-like isoform X2 [Drosophila miranda]|uniref:apoptosis-stimulating of p53 protein 1-like isoform X2 n=1 Tax=Drosophila miranda TaxID=7229 RepID=UPI00143F4ED5|nr:apoptosis-stimulating of p53 protein 1-like isoform X2 [Drosophila miranda]XP_033252583.1 apoptosis-stimulating of p53 protein 1-like isoform X2 [Drosophila miranda]
MKEPTNTLDEIVPSRLTSAELRAMALRQRQQIDSQHQLLATKEQRLRFLKSQEVRSAVASAVGERLRRLRERVEAQESKLRRLRALRGQVDLQKTYNVNLSNDLDSIRALFSEKEKELSLAVAKVETLTRQLEELRRDRCCPVNLLAATTGNGVGQALPPQASRELEKLRRELMYRNQLSLQQDARLHMQREALQQRQAELRSVDQRIYELQTRLQRKKQANTHHQQQQHLQQHPQQQKHHQPNHAPGPVTSLSVKHGGVAALKQLLLQKQVNQLAAAAAAAAAGRARGNVAAVEPFIHTPQKSTITSSASYLSGGSMLKHAAATANTNQQNQLIQDLTHMKMKMGQGTGGGSVPVPVPVPVAVSVAGASSSSESDESKLAKKLLTAAPAPVKTGAELRKQAQTEAMDSTTHIYAEVGPKKRDREAAAAAAAAAAAQAQAQAAAEAAASTATTEAPPAPANPSKIPKSISSSGSTSSASALINKLNQQATKDTQGDTGHQQHQQQQQQQQQQKKNEIAVTSEMLSERSNQQQLTVHSMPLGAIRKSVALAVSNAAKPLLVQVTNLAVPPRKPLSSVAPTSVSGSSSSGTGSGSGSSIPKMITYSPKVNRVAPNVVQADQRPALPPKPSKMTPTEQPSSSPAEASSGSTAAPSPTMAKSQGHGQGQGKAPAHQTQQVQATFGLQSLNINDNLPIKAKPLTIRKQPLFEQPRLKSSQTATGSSAGQPKQPLQQQHQQLQSQRKSEPARPPQEAAKSSPEPSPPHSPSSESSVDEPDRVAPTKEEQETPVATPPTATTSNIKERTGGKPKLGRRVSFDPLALLLDASLEGELELVKKTAMKVANPSAANDEGITALHNAICAGHFDIVKFLVEFGCDVNAQDSDGWTPLHCAASCNNLSMVTFLVESGACLFASTLSDHETPAEKCEEDEEGFDGCSEYLCSLQEKLGILHNGDVYAVFSYEAQNGDELSFRVNEPLIVLRKGDDAENEWWWARNVSGEEGYVPRNLLGLYPRVPPQSPHYGD